MHDPNVVVSAPHVKWDAFPQRSTWNWPGEARVAVSFLLHVEFLPLSPPGELPNLPASAVHRGPYPRYVDVHEITPHEYGNRVGLFRLMDLLDGYMFPASAAVDTVIAQSYPAVVDAIGRRGWSVLGHGVGGGQLHSEAMAEREEHDAIQQNLEVLREKFDREIRGWASAEYAESSRTVELLRNAGLKYICGRPNDEQPYPLTEDLTCLPVAIHLDDVFAGRLRKVTAIEYADSIGRALDRMITEEPIAPRHLVLGLHPWFSGQPFRAKQLNRVLERLFEDPAVWVADTDSIFDHYRSVREGSR